MKLGNIICKEMKSCTICPYNKERLLKVCTSFKLSEPLKKGLHNSKKELSKRSVEEIQEKLNTEVKND